MDRVGFEPTTYGLWDRRSYRWTNGPFEIAGVGFEPTTLWLWAIRASRLLHPAMFFLVCEFLPEPIVRSVPTSRKLLKEGFMMNIVDSYLFFFDSQVSTVTSLILIPMLYLARFDRREFFKWKKNKWYYRIRTCSWFHNQLLPNWALHHKLAETFDQFSIASAYVGIDLSHSRLSCSYDRHKFRGNLQILALSFYRFPFNTSFLAGYRDCGLLRLHLLVLSHMLPCERHMSPYFRWISRFSAQSRAHFRFFFFLFILISFQTLFWLMNILTMLCVLFLDDEVHVWPFVSFEYDPIIATLSVLRTYFTSIAFLSIWDNVFVIMTTLLFAVIVSSGNWQFTHFCDIEPVSRLPLVRAVLWHKSQYVNGSPQSLSNCRINVCHVGFPLYCILVPRTKIQSQCL